MYVSFFYDANNYASDGSRDGLFEYITITRESFEFGRSEIAVLAREKVQKEDERRSGVNYGARRA